MKIEELKKISEAPLKGSCIAYTKKEVIFEEYASLDELTERVKGAEILELHLFDDEKEYRCVKTASKRYPTGVIEVVADFPEDEENVYPEEVFLEDNEGKLKVLHHLTYDENGMASADNYRLIRR